MDKVICFDSFAQVGYDHKEGWTNTPLSVAEVIKGAVCDFCFCLLLIPFGSAHCS